MPAQQVVGQDVGPDLLRGAGLDEQVAQVFPFPLLGGLLVEELVEARGDPALQRERQPRRDECQDDEHPVQAGQEPGHEHDGHDVARESQDRPGEIAGPPGDVPLGPRQAVVPVGVVEVAEVELRRLLEEPALRLELHSADVQVSAVALVGADSALHPGGDPQADDDRKEVGEAERVELGFGNAIDEHGAEVHGDGRHRRGHHPQHRIADQQARRRRPGQAEALAQVVPDPAGAAAGRGRGGGRAHATLPWRRSSSSTSAYPDGYDTPSVEAPASSSIRTDSGERRFTQ